MTRKRFTSEEGFQTIDLLVAARDHLLAARCLLRDCLPFGLDSAGYLLHLGAELILKAWLLHTSGEFSDSHVLSSLAAALETKSAVVSDPETQAKLAKLDKLNELRYPNPSEGVAITESEAHDLFEVIYALFDALPPEIQNLPFPYRADEQGRLVKDNRFLMVRPRKK